MKRKLALLPLAAVLVLGACTTMPSGPSHMALPGTGKNFDQFRIDDYDCRQYANASVNNTTPGQVNADSGVKSAAVGAGVGALAGAAIGNSGRAAATGAGVGLLIGALAGAGAGDRSSYALQRNYDAGYTQCMYAKGHKVPVNGRVNYTTAAPAPAPAYNIPPPPPGNPPPPPPR
jgi:hypothetical protein